MATSTSSADIKSVKIPTFNGNRDAFQVCGGSVVRLSSKPTSFDLQLTIKKESDLPDKEEPQSGDTK
jgi:hypothetical protein